MNIVHFDQSNKDEWDSFIRGQDHHIFHYFAWSEIFSSAYRFKPLYFGVKDDSGNLVAAFPLFLTNSVLFGRSMKSMPYHVEGGPVISNSVKDLSHLYRVIYDHLLKLQTEYRVRNIDIKTRDEAFLQAVPHGERRIYHTYYRYLCDLSAGEEPLLKALRPDVRSNIRRAARFGVQAEVTDKSADIELFYDLYVMWAKCIGLPGHSRKFFRLIWNHFYPLGMTKIVFAHYQNNLAAAKLFLLDPANGVALQNWGAISNFDLKKFQINTALHWTEICWSIKNGYRLFDFGVTSEHHKGSNYFKEGWNTNQVTVAFTNLGDFSRTNIRDDHNAGGAFRAIWKRVPTTISERVGPWILRQGN